MRPDRRDKFEWHQKQKHTVCLWARLDRVMECLQNLGGWETWFLGAAEGGSRSAPQGSEVPVISLCSRLSQHVLSCPQDPWDGTSVSVRPTPGTPSACPP